jgi:hypothetical protein
VQPAEYNATGIAMAFSLPLFIGPYEVFASIWEQSSTKGLTKSIGGYRLICQRQPL